MSRLSEIYLHFSIKNDVDNIIHICKIERMNEQTNQAIKASYYWSQIFESNSR